MKKLTKLLMSAVFTMAVAGAAMAADLPVEEFPGGIDDDPTAPVPTLSTKSAGRDLPVEEYPGGTGGSGNPTDPSLDWTGKPHGLRDIIQNFFSTAGR